MSSEANLSLEEIESLVDYSSRYFMERLWPLQQRMDDEEWWPADDFKALAEMGLLGVNLHGYAWKQDGCVAARLHGIIVLSPGRFVGPVPAINPALERVVDAAARSE